MRFLWEHLRGWHLDIPTLVGTLLFLPLASYFIGILRKHGKAWGGYLIEGTMYWVGRFVIHSLSARFSLRRYCRLQLHRENQYLHVPSRSDIKLEIDRVFVNLVLEHQGDGTESYNQNTLLASGNRIRVVGDPGSGKSSLIKRLFRDACSAALETPSKAKLPILIELKNLKLPRDVEGLDLGNWFYELVREEVNKSDVYKMGECFDNYAQTSGLLVLLDGLDEVASSDYETAQAAITALSDQLSNRCVDNTVVLTMRTQLHQQVKDAFRTSFGRAVFVKPFSPSDVFEFLSRWPFADRRLGPLLYAELTDRPTLREMCTSPLVLAMYVAERQSGLDPITPESRTEFYRKVMEELLVKRRLRQVGPALAIGKLREQRQRILGRLAYDHMLDKTQPANSLRWEEAVRVVRTVMKCKEEEAAVTFLEIARDTGLVSEEKTRESFRFIHLTFCEFLAAHESVEGEKDGFNVLVRKHKALRTDPDPGAGSRLLEVVPFACGLVPRSQRDDVLTAVASIGDNRLLARCFLETKTYEHPSWPIFAESTRSRLLNTPEPEWNERWLQDLHLFNVVVRDARLCSAHVPNVGAEIDLGEFYESLVKKQSKSLSRVLGAFASQDALAAFRLAEISGLDLAADFPEVIIANCDQAPFLSLTVERMLSEGDRLSLWAAPLAEAALSSRLVATLLDKFPADRGVAATALKAIPARLRWDASNAIMKDSLYPQVLTLAIAFDKAHPTRRLGFQHLEVLATVPPPGHLRWMKSWFGLPLLPMVLLLIAGLFPFTFVILDLRFSDSFLITFGSLLLVIAAYLSLFRRVAIKVFYRLVVNRWATTPEFATRKRPLLLFVFVASFSRIITLFLTRKERQLLTLVLGNWEQLLQVPRAGWPSRSG